MEGRKRKPGRGTVHREVRGVQHGSSKRKDRKKRKASAKKGERGGALKRYAGLRQEVGTEPDLYGPMDYAKTLKLQFRVGDLDLPERRKGYTTSREEEKGAQMCPCGEAVSHRGRNVKRTRRNGMW